MGIWISRFRVGRFRPGISLGREDFRRRRAPPDAVVVIEPPADPVDRVFRDFIRLDSDQRARLLRRILLFNG
jgi:hypothetical protein